jgi:hypothetical protein
MPLDATCLWVDNPITNQIINLNIKFKERTKIDG